ncbi:hypothetical protein OBBRIDRAFT_788596 [Obba rivulosa]|uniref:F-box domain-containing protein n=1 Tax=Obba rivulosa TaxID=1052685 RepID=A0A8E2J5E4_9APHY|nr:hypothetical protein OBBRIDRAFT_788596 [Obba rivulosa]
MHRCLQTADILLLILRQLEYNDFPLFHRDTRTLAVLARTCRDWNELALDVLWEGQLWGLVSLVKCLPADAWSIDVEEPIDPENAGPNQKPPTGVVSVIKPLFAADWERFDLYARRIKLLQLALPPVQGGIALCLQPASLATLLAFHFPRPLLPALRTLILQPGSEFGGLLNMLVGSSLTYLRVDWPVNLDHIPLLAHVAHVSQHLTHLQIARGDTTYRPGLLLGLRHLQQVEIELPLEQELASDMLAWLTQLPQLCRLVLHRITYCLFELSAMSHANPLPAFAKLKILKITSDSLPILISSLNLYSTSPLRCIVLGEPNVFPKIVSLSTLDNILETMTRLFDHSRLTTLGLMFGIARTDSGVVRLRNLKMMLSCHNLINLNFRFPIPVALSDGDMKELAMALPRLQSLQLGNRSGDNAAEPKPTLQAFVHLATYCPHLRVLALTIDASQDLQLTTEHPGHGCRLLHLTQLDVGTSKIGSPHIVAMFLSDLCPSIHWLRHGVQATPDTAKWDVVARYLTILIPVRRQERDRYQALMMSQNTAKRDSSANMPVASNSVAR